MRQFSAFAAAMVLSSLLAAQQPNPPVRPKIGKPEILKLKDVRPGMKGYAWTVLSGTEPEPIPVEIVGLLKNQWGPKQDVIVAKMYGAALRTNVAGGMSGSPVYVNGKLVGAVALRMSQFSPDSVCGITPIEYMLNVNEFDSSIPSDAKTPESPLGKAVPTSATTMEPIDTPLALSGFHESVIREFAPAFQQMGVTVASGGASSTLTNAKPVPGWEKSLAPGDAVTGVLVSGDMSMTGMCTVTYNDGKNVLLCGHSFFNLGPVDMPMAKSEVLMTLASQFQPNKMGNATEIVGALHQDRHSAVEGVLGSTAGMVPVTVHIRSFDEKGMRAQHDLHYSVFVQQKWTPYLMMLTMYNSISGLNEFAEEATYRLSGKVEFAEAGQADLAVSTMLAPGEQPTPVPMQLAAYWGEKFNRLFLNPVELPKLRSVDATIDLIPQRRVATIENAWIPSSEVEPGTEIPLKVFLRPYRGERIEREFKLKLPATLARGEHKIVLSDAETLNRMQTSAGLANHFLDIPQTVSLINQERSNNQVYISLVEARPTMFYEDKAMPALPASVLNVMQTGRTASKRLASSPESAIEQGSIPLDLAVNGSYTLKVSVK